MIADCCLALTLMVAFPVALAATVGLKFFTDWVRDRIELRWPDNKRAEAAGWWFRLLLPVVVIALLLTIFWYLIPLVRVKAREA